MGVRMGAVAEWVYYIPCEIFKDGAVLCWHVLLRSIPGQATVGNFFEPRIDCDEPSLVSIFDIDSKNIVCCNIVFKPPHFQFIDYPGLRTEPVALRIFREGPWRCLAQIAGHNACWQLCRSVVQDIAAFQRVQVPPGSNFVELLQLVVAKLTGKNGDDVMVIIYKRLAELHASTTFADFVNELDEATDVLEDADKEVVKQEQEHNVATGTAANEFERHFVVATRKVRESLRLAKKKKKEGSKDRIVFKALFHDQFGVSQKEAKKLAPPKASIWRAVTGRCGWHGHLPPNKRVGYSVGPASSHTCKEALIPVCSEIWRQHFCRTGENPFTWPYDFNSP